MARGAGFANATPTFFEQLAREGEVAVPDDRAAATGSSCSVLEQPNVRAAIQWSLDHGSEARALRTATSFYRFWGKASGAEGRMWLDRVLATGAGTPGERAKALFVAGQLAFLHGETSRAVELLEAAISAARESGDIGGARDVARLVRLGGTTSTATATVAWPCWRSVASGCQNSRIPPRPPRP